MLELYLALVDTPEEKDKFEELYYTYKQDMYAIAYNILNNNEDAEDAVSQAFFIIAKNFTKISLFSSHELLPYIVIIVKNISRNLYKKNKAEREHTIPVEYDASFFLETYPEDDYFRLVEAIKKLPQEYKDTVILYYHYDFTAKFVGQKLGISEDAVRKRAERAKAMLRKMLDERDNYD